MVMVAIFMVATSVSPLTVSAQSSSTYVGNPSKNGPAQPYTPLSPLPTCTGVGCSNSVSTSVNFQGYIQNTFNFIIFVAAAAAVFMITYGGFQYMTTDSVQGKSEGLKKARNAVYGLLLVLGSFLILRTIDPRLVAIPSTLVTPLNINYTKANADFTSALGQTINQYHSNTQTALDAIAAGNAQEQQIQSDLTAADNAICDYSGYTDTCTDNAAAEVCQNVLMGSLGEDLDNACATRASLLEQEQAVQQNTALATAVGLATGGAFLENCSPTGDPSLCDPSNYPNLVSQFSSEVSPDQLPALRSAELYELSVFEMYQHVALLNQAAGDSSITKAKYYVLGTQYLVEDPTVGNTATYNLYKSTLNYINSTASAFMNSANADPKLVAQMKTQQTALFATMNGMTYH